MDGQDLDAVRGIYNHYIVGSTATFHAQPLTGGEMKKLVFFNTERYRTFVICGDEKICGYVFISQHKKRQAYDDTAEVSVYLEPAATGQGLGTMALRHIEEYARGQKMHVLIATITGENLQSIQLFVQNGYEKCAHYREVGRKFGRLLDVVAYQKIL